MKIAKEGTYERFRMLCTALESEHAWREDGEKNYEKSRQLIDACNERVTKIFGEKINSIFKLMQREHRDEHWSGDERYKLFGWNFGSYSDRANMKSALVYMVEFDGKPLEYDKVERLYSLVKHGLYWELCRVDLKASDEERNGIRGKELAAWRKIMENMLRATLRRLTR